MVDVFSSPENLPIKGHNVVLLSGLKTRTEDELRAVLTSLGGELLFFQVIRAVDTAICCYATEEQAAKVVAELQNEDVHLGDEVVSDSESEEDESLAPARVALFMTSPPPSPPEGWRPLHEGINRRTHAEDMQEVALSPGKTLLLEKAPSRPRIVVESPPPSS